MRNKPLSGIFGHFFSRASFIQSLFAALFLAVVLPFFSHITERMAAEQGRTFANSTLAATVDALYKSQYGDVVDYCMEVIRSTPNILFIVYSDEDGRELIINPKQWRFSEKSLPYHNIRFDPASSEAALSEIHFIRDLGTVFNPTGAFEYSRPIVIGGKNWGVLTVGFSKEPYFSSIQKFVVTVVALVLLSCGLSFYLFFASSRRIRQQIGVFEGIAQRLASGQLSVRAPETSIGEIGVLGNAINGIAAALEEKSRRLAQLVSVVEQTDDGLVLFDKSLKIVFANDALLALTGYPGFHFIGLSIRDFANAVYLSGPDSDWMVTGLQISRTRDLIIKKKDGSPIDVEVRMETISSDQVGVEYFLAVIADISERKQAELALGKANRLLQESISSLADGFTIFDENDRLVVCNEAYRNMYGAIRDLIVPGASFEEIVRGGMRLGQFNEANGPADQSAKERLVQERVRKHQAADGSHLEQILDDGRCVLTVEYRTPSGFIVGNRINISALKAVEAELEQHRHHLESMVEARTAALTIAKEAAESATRAKDTFLATMSHELRTPMNAIMGMTELARRRAVDPKQVDQLNKVSRASSQLLAIINDILDISRVEAERLTLERLTMSLRSVMDNLDDLLCVQAVEKHLDLVIDLAPDLGKRMIVGDPLRLGQILLNLAGNAIKFTTQGSVTVRAMLIEESPVDVLLRFEVEDTGVGIAVEHQERIFRAFEQADGSSTRKYGGTGLGLSISKRLVELMGGAIGVRSHPGRGTTFWFTARFEKPDDAVGSPRKKSPDAAIEQIRIRHTGAQVLLVEDEPINQEVARGLLEAAGLVVDIANDGIEAVTQVGRKHYDLILMDVLMPRMNGLDASVQIRTMPNGYKVPILAMTANAFVDDEMRCRKAGMNDFMSKPVDPEVFFATLLKWLTRP